MGRVRRARGRGAAGLSLASATRARARSFRGRRATWTDRRGTLRYARLKSKQMPFRIARKCFKIQRNLPFCVNCIWTWWKKATYTLLQADVALVVMCCHRFSASQRKSRWKAPPWFFLYETSFCNLYFSADAKKERRHISQKLKVQPIEKPSYGTGRVRADKFFLASAKRLITLFWNNEYYGLLLEFLIYSNIRK